jgi:site-specific recombinase XerD
MCRKPASKRTRPKPKAVLRLPDSDQAKSAVLNSLTSADAQRGYRHAIEEFVEAVELSFAHIQQREEHWAIVDLKGKAGHTRTIPMPGWVKNVVDQWIQAANITSCKLFRRVHKMGKTWGEKLTEKAVWHVVREYATKAGIDKLSPHDLRRTCARLCHASGGELEQIQFLLGHVSVQTTERYLGCKQRIQDAGSDKIGIGPPE